MNLEECEIEQYSSPVFDRTLFHKNDVTYTVRKRGRYTQILLSNGFGIELASGQNIYDTDKLVSLSYETYSSQFARDNKLYEDVMEAIFEHSPNAVVDYIQKAVKTVFEEYNIIAPDPDDPPWE